VVKSWVWLALATALAGCGDQQHSVKAEVTLSGDTGALTMACHQSSSGECHGIVVGAVLARGTAKVGSSATIEGVMPGARFCVSDVEADPAKCDLKEITVGTTIIRHQKVGSD